MSIVDQDYTCFFCHKSFRYQTLLRRHVRCHTGEKPYICIFCNQTFTQKSNLEKHVRIHTGERPFQCHFCHRSFTQKSNVHRHMRTHTGERPYLCHLCNRSFSQKSNVERHMKTHMEMNTEILDSNVSSPSYSAKTVLNQNTKDIFDKITNSLKPEGDNAVSVKSSTEMFLHNPIRRDVENIISPITILDGAHKIFSYRNQKSSVENIISPMTILDGAYQIFSYRDQNAKNRILSQNYILYKTEADIPFQIISKDDFHRKESKMEIFDSVSDIAEEKSSFDKTVSVHSHSDNNNTIIDNNCIEIKTPPHERLFGKKSDKNKNISQLENPDSCEPNLQENEPKISKIDPYTKSDYLTEKKSVKKFIPQMRKSYQEIRKGFDDNIETMDQPVSDNLEDYRLNGIKSFCDSIKKTITFKSQHGLLEDKIELQEDKKIQLQNPDSWEPNLQENEQTTVKIDPYIDSEYLIEKKSVKKFIPQMRKPYKEIGKRLDQNIEIMDQPASDYLEDYQLNDIKSSCSSSNSSSSNSSSSNSSSEKNLSFKTRHNLLEDKKIDPCINSEYLIEKELATKIIPQMKKPHKEIREGFDGSIETMVQPVSNYLEDYQFNGIKSSCDSGEENITFKIQHSPLEEKIELQEDDKEEPIRIVDNVDATILNSQNIFETNTNQVASTVGIDDYHCPICLKTFAHKCNVGKHMLLHTGVKPYRCIICGKTFSQKCNTQRHMKTHATNQQQQQQQSKNFEESSENSSILEKNKIKDSTEIHSNEELVKISNQSSSNVRSITNSVLKESSTDFAKEFSNNEYHSSSSSRSSIQQVNTINKKTFKCEFCPTMFWDLAELSRHSRVHKEKHPNDKSNGSTKDLDFRSPCNRVCADMKRSSPDLLSCEFCGHKFLDLWELSKHEEICHLENKAFTCEPCQSIILGTKEYLNHLKKFHKKTDSII